MKLGSLFDGSGGFPLAGCLCGIEPVWASEVEPYPIAVTRTRFKGMKHLGDISKMNGYTIEPVDIITFGSPCQDLSVAGKRAGLKHAENGDEETTRSGLFMEAVRIIKEMRRATNGKYPSFALWENVPGAFSSNKGEDFRTVLEELIKIVEPKAVMPPVPQGGWPYADSYCGDGWSLAYRVFDAQYWGVPQRRRRIHLVLDLRGDRAQEVLFEREGLRGYFAEGGTPWEGIAADAQDRPGADDRAGEGFDGYNGDLTGDVSSTLGVNCGMSTGRNGVIEYRGGTPLACEPVAYSFDSLSSNSMKSKNPHSGCRQVEIAKTLDTTDPNPCKNQGGIAIVEPVPYTLKIRSGCEGGGKGALIQTDKSATLSTLNDQYLFQPVPNLLLDDQEGEFADYVEGELGTLKAAGGDLGDGSEDLIVEGMDCRNGVLNGDLCATPQAKPNGGFSYNCIHPVIIATPPRYIVRRLTPTECARLQGFPDTWGHLEHKDDFTEEEVAFWNEVRNTHAAINGKPTKDYTKAQLLTWYNKLHTDSAEYKMWGNGIALPPALYVMQGIKDALEAANET